MPSTGHPKNRFDGISVRKACNTSAIRIKSDEKTRVFFDEMHLERSSFDGESERPAISTSMLGKETATRNFGE